MTQTDNIELEKPVLLIPNVYDEGFKPEDEAHTLMYVFIVIYERKSTNSLADMIYHQLLHQ